MMLVKQEPNAAGKWGVVVFVHRPVFLLYIVVEDSSVGNTSRDIEQTTFKLRFYKVPVVTVPYQTSAPGAPGHCFFVKFGSLSIIVHSRPALKNDDAGDLKGCIHVKTLTFQHQ